MEATWVVLILFKIYFYALNIVQWQKSLRRNPTSPYIRRGLLPLQSVMPGRAVAPQMRCSLWEKGPLVVGLQETKPVAGVGNLALSNNLRNEQTGTTLSWRSKKQLSPFKFQRGGKAKHDKCQLPSQETLLWNRPNATLSRRHPSCGWLHSSEEASLGHESTEARTLMR